MFHYTKIYQLFVHAQLHMETPDLDEINQERARLVRDGIYPMFGWRKKKNTGKRCPRCCGPLFLSDIPGYKYQCFNCEEDFYSIEVK